MPGIDSTTRRRILIYRARTGPLLNQLRLVHVSRKLEFDNKKHIVLTEPNYSWFVVDKKLL